MGGKGGGEAESSALLLGAEHDGCLASRRRHRIALLCHLLIERSHIEEYRPSRYLLAQRRELRERKLGQATDLGSDETKGRERRGAADCRLLR
jgi:hypothetical protein